MDTHAVSATVTRGSTALDSVVGYIISHRHSRDRSCDTAFNLSMVGRKAFSVCGVGAWGASYHSVHRAIACAIKLQVRCVLTFRSRADRPQAAGR